MLTPYERRLLIELRDRFPLAARPYSVIARRMGSSEGKAIETARRLRWRGIIRSIGIVFAPHRLGCRSTLVAMRVPSRELRRIAGIVGGYPGVSHSY
ncbi:MAG: Lrp/AsnC family transcriptional regulator, partial [Candidatus Aureabacteria bacterium]|nr:Lrp/AsnC family transcriptional regulator [Candidatus Auribacterota bacterium]